MPAAKFSTGDTKVGPGRRPVKQPVATNHVLTHQRRNDHLPEVIM